MVINDLNYRGDSAMKLSDASSGPDWIVWMDREKQNNKICVRGV